MFHTNTESQVQQQIISDFSTPTGTIRVLIATIAYGMGVDASGVNQTILCGRPTGLDDYVQMSGRIGRDGTPSVAVTVCFPGNTAGRTTSDRVKEFIAGNRCRRDVIKEEFGNSSNSTMVAHTCDICAQSCECGCKGKDQSCFERSMRSSLQKRGDK
nr:ATP-dependent DNA helicase RecQ-like [Lytechinus pictus]